MSHLFKDPKKFKKLLKQYKVDPTLRIYKTVPTKELMNASVILRFCKFKPIVNHSEKLMALLKSVVGQGFYFRIVKETLGRHFTAGENLDECRKLITYLDSMGIQTMINYMMEFVPGSLFAEMVHVFLIMIAFST